MSRSINKVILVGNVGRDPDVQSTQAGTKVAHFSLATSRRVPRNGAIEERTDWHRLTVWDRLAELVEDYVRRGDRLYVEGRVEYDSYEREGVTIPTAEITVRELVMLGSPSGRAAASADAAGEAEDAGAAAESDGAPAKGAEKKSRAKAATAS